MRTLLAATLFIYFSSNVLTARSELVNITFQVIAPTLNDSSDVYIVGNHEKLGNWDPGAIKLKKMSGDTWSISSQFPKGFTLEFKFTKGSWEQEAVRVPDHRSRLQRSLDLYSLSRDARTVVEIVLGTYGHIDGEEAKPEEIRLSIHTLLCSMGWSFGRIVESFREIRVALTE